MGIGENIKFLREKNQLTQDELAKIIGVTDKAISFWEIGKYKPRMGSIQKIADYFGIQKSNIIEDDGMEKLFIIQKQPNIKEMELLLQFHKLNDLGQEKIIEDIRNLNFVPKYQKKFSKNNLENNKKETSTELAIAPTVLKRVYFQEASAGLGRYSPEDANDKFEEISFNANEVPHNAEFGIRISGDSMEPLIHDKQIVFVIPKTKIKYNDIGIFVIDGEVFCKKIVFENEQIIFRSINSKYSDIVMTKTNRVNTIGKVLFK